jgi:hypothetical protein
MLLVALGVFLRVFWLPFLVCYFYRASLLRYISRVYAPRCHSASLPRGFASTVPGIPPVGRL